MKALLLNSGIGSRLGLETKKHPKCMTKVDETNTIISRQLEMLSIAGIKDVIITTGPFSKDLEEYCISLNLPIKYEFVNNPIYMETNYIYSIYLARECLWNDDILLMHGDIVFEQSVLESILSKEESCVVISSSTPLPEKDFKAVLNSTKVEKIGVEFFEDAVTSQPIYKLKKKDWSIWLDEICSFCENGEVKCYAEKALNNVLKRLNLYSLDVREMLCGEIDTEEDLNIIKKKIKQKIPNRVFMSFSTDIIHSGHLAMLNRAASLGRLTVGVLSDSVVAEYKRFPMVPFEERKKLLENIKGVDWVIEQTELTGKDIILKLKPDIVVHGDDWHNGALKPIRDEVIELLNSYGGKLIEYPYTEKEVYHEIEKRMRAELSIPDFRRGRLKKAIQMKGGIVNAIEVHSGITGLIAENTKVEEDGKIFQFDAMWVSSLCDSTAKGKPDIELVDLTSRLRTIDDIMEVTTKPIIFDGDTGGLIEHFTYTVKSLERMGVSMIIIEDKTGLKKNSLFGTEVEQTQDSIENFCAKIAAGQKAKKTNDFMIVARIESLILEQGMEDALQRAFAYVGAGADGIMIHSRKEDPDEILDFIAKFREKDTLTPIVIVPTTFDSVTEEEWKKAGVNVVIYANQLTRSGIPAMQRTAELILRNHRAKEADDLCMPIKDIIRLIPEEN